MTALLGSAVGAADGQRGSATLVGVVRDTAKSPLGQADVSIPALSISARTDDAGRFRLRDVPPGTHAVLFRRVGYGPIEDQITFAEKQVVDRQVVLARVTTLDTVVTMSSYRDPGMLDFEEHRKMGLGHFVTRADILKREGAILSSFLLQTPGLRLVSVRGYEWVTSKRATRSSCGPAASECLRREGLYYAPDDSEKSMGMPVLCHARVYLDNQLQNPGSPATPVDLRQFLTNQVEAIEWFAGPSQTPMKYMTRNSTCGTLVIHTRRSR